MVNYFILFALVLACTANLVPRAVDLGKVYKFFTDESKGRVIAVYIALVGIVCLLICFFFLPPNNSLTRGVATCTHSAHVSLPRRRS